MTETEPTAADPAPESEEARVRVLNPPNFLKQKIKIAPGLLEDLLAQADKAVSMLQDEFAAGTQMRINRLNEVYLQWRIPAKRDEAILDFRAISHELKGEAGTFGYNLITQIADLFGDYLRDTPPAVQRPEAIKSYVDTFQIVWGQKIAGDGGETGRQLILILMKLNEKATAPKPADQA